jgi:chemotaxis protein methyltransferase CheR
MTLPTISRDETCFFRDPRSFREFRRWILPELITRRAETRRLRIWSAGCSTGQEPYSLALVLFEDFPSLKTWNVSILASDGSTERVAQARRGRYTQAEVNRGLPAPHLIRSFRRDGLAWTIDEPIRRSIDFRVIDLVEAWSSPLEFDLIALRNVLPDLEGQSQSAILSRLARVLAPDGTLWLGEGETLIERNSPFERVTPERGSFYRPRRS